MPRNGQHFRDRPNVIRVLDDEKKQALFLDEFKLEVPSVGVLDAPYRCYAINHEWAKIIIGFVGWLATIAPWDGAEDESHDGVVGVLKFISQSGVCNMLQVRQSPTEPCVLEYSDDEGSSWSEFADILDCITPTFLENSIVNALNTNTTIQQIIDNLVDGGTDNDLPPTPTLSEPDLLCDSAYYVTDKIIDFIDQTLTDASTITLEEFISGLLGLGGFEGSLLVLFWDLIVANSYPDLLTDVQDSRDEIAEILYCNELDKDLSIIEIDASTIGTEAQSAFIGAINAITDGKWSLWAFVGSQVDSGESCLCGWVYDSDFLNQDDGWIGYQGTPPYDSVRAVWSLGNGWEETDAPEFSGFYSRKDDFVFDMSPTYIDYVSITYDLTKGTYTSNLTAVAIIVTLDGGGTVVNTIAYNSTVNGSGQTFSLPVDDVVTSIRVLIRASTSTIGIGSLTGTGQVTNVQVAGTGINPFV